MKERKKEEGMLAVFKYIGFGAMFVLLGILGVGVFLFYLIRKILEPG